MRYAISEQIKSKRHFVLWFSFGDLLPYWYSDLEGNEIKAFKTIAEGDHAIELEEELLSLSESDPRRETILAELNRM